MPTAARFTPSLLDEATLEALFVGRHHFVDDCVARIHKAATSKSRSAKLFVGPRGAGKTHLLSLVNYRARHLDEFGKSFQIAWLPEDLWTIDSLESLLKEIVRALEPIPAVSGASQIETPLQLIRKAVSMAGPIVVLIENIDQVFEAMSNSGQRELRALIENTGSLLFIATSKRSTESLTKQSSPFYGFFDTTELERFSVDDAALMLKRIADQNGNTELSAFLDTRRARRRLAAISHLAGGQPRVWSLLASGLTVEGLDDLVGVLMERFDDLTPYYQEQMGRLSMNERKTIRALADLDHSCTVKHLATATGIFQRSISKTISDLRLKGWVRQRTGRIVEAADGRHSYYDLAEPLARLVFQLKESRGKPIRLIVDFLKLWFDEDAFGLVGNLAAGGPAGEYLNAVRTEDDTFNAARLVDLLSRESLRFSRLTQLEVPADLQVVDPQLCELLCELDDGLACLEQQDASMLLVLPASLTGLVEMQLDEGSTVQAQRTRLARLAPQFNQPEIWIGRVESLFSQCAPGNSEIAAILSLLYAQNQQLELAEVVLKMFCEWSTIDEAVYLAIQLYEYKSPKLALLAMANKSLDPTQPYSSIVLQVMRTVCLSLSGEQRAFFEAKAELQTFLEDNAISEELRSLVQEALDRANKSIELF
jgi:DNA-binding MarR family transcriptional regulator